MGEAARKIKVVNPATLEEVAEYPITDEAGVHAAIDRAREAQKVWGKLSVRDRTRHLLKVRDYMLDNLDRITDVICKETGKPRADALMADVMVICELIGYYAKKAPSILAPKPVDPGLLMHKRGWITYMPRGVVGVISPWNFPFNLAAGPTVTALTAGNTVVLKPSKVTTGSGAIIGECFAAMDEHKDIVQVTTGDSTTGTHIVRSNVDQIAFTGSTEVGRFIAVECAKQLKPVLLELGGKDPMIVCRDADVERAARGAVWGAFNNAGQVCMSVERVYVEEPIYDEFVARVVELTNQLKQGLYDEPGVDVGSMIYAPQIDTVEAHVEEAKQMGAKVLVGGHRNTKFKGAFYEPTVLADVTDEMKVMREETFGPLLPIMKVKDAAEALERSNNSVYGLNSSVWSKDAAKARRLAEGMQAGACVINDVIVSYAMSELPFGGVKESGIGRTHGAEGLVCMSHIKAIAEDRLGVKREQTWFPYHPKTYGIGKKLMRTLYRSGVGAKIGALLGK
ncbi:MAG: aldehyde dehydrogenase family protein [Myxococcales bacterium]|nr:aldehyde dehydrogenase family protein [Myxococcales bacterium]